MPANAVTVTANFAVIPPVQTATPVITTPIYNGATSVSGTSENNASISLTVNGGSAHTTTASAGGAWTVTGLTLATGNPISVTALGTGAGETVSAAATATVVVAPPSKGKPTQTFLVSLPNPSDNGQTVYFGVAVFSIPFKGIPTGTVTFKDGSSVIGKGTLDKLGLTSINVGNLSSGVHDIIATYSGDSNFTTSTSNMVIQKVRYVTTIVLISNTQSSVIGQPVQFTATVSPMTATGSITFYDGNIRLSSASLSSGVASISTSKLTIGTHNITAIYSRDNNFSSSISNVVIQIITKH